MKNLRGFSEGEVGFVKDALNQFMQSYIGESCVITGFNYYYTLAHPGGLLISISYQHRNQKHLEAILDDLRGDADLSNLLSSERTAELPLTREKRAVYFFRKDWPLPKDPRTGKLLQSVELFNYYSEELLDRSKLESAETLNDIPEYQESTYPIGLCELDGIELNLNVKTEPESRKAVNLFRTKGFRMRMTNTGLTYYEDGKPVLVSDTWPDPDRTPCIILGRQISSFFPEGLPDFKEVHKIALIKAGNEISFCINKKYSRLLKHPAYGQLKERFGASLHDIVAYANNAFVAEYIDIE